MTQLLPDDENGKYQVGYVGSISDIAERLYNELSMIGYSIFAEDIVVAIQNDYLFYAGWQKTHDQYIQQGATVDKDTRISVDEWGVIERVVRAHCDLLQANRVDSLKSLGGEAFGLSVSEASTAYSQAKEEMKKDSFFEPPFIL